MSKQYLEVGQVTSIHGIAGEVKVMPWADSPEFLCQFKTMYLDGGRRPVRVEQARVQKNMVLLKLEGISDPDSARALRNTILFIDRKDAQLPEGSIFLADLYGLEVRDAKTDAVLGSVADIMTLPANNVYVVRGGEREILIPAVPQFIAETNVEKGYIKVNMMEGL